MEQSASDKFLALTKRTDIVTPSEAEVIYNQLEPMKSDVLINGGQWSVGLFKTEPDHPACAIARPMPGLLKLFRSTEDVDPMTIIKDGKRVTHEYWGQARLRDMPFRGVLSSAMIYDDHPMIDYFRYVSDDIVACALDAKLWKDLGTLYFYLIREDSTA